MVEFGVDLSRNQSCCLSGSRDMIIKEENKKKNNREKESSNLPACLISETVSSLVKHIVVGSSRLDNHSQLMGELEFHFCISL